MPQPQTEAERKFADALEALMEALYSMVNCGDVRGAHELVAAIGARLLLDRVRSASLH